MENKSLDCKEFVNELLKEGNILEVLRRVDDGRGRAFYDCFEQEVHKPMFQGQTELEESLRKAIEIYDKLQEARKSNDDRILKLAEDALTLPMRLLDKEKMEKIGENWNKIPRELKEKLLQIFISYGRFFPILYLVSQFPEYLEILEKYKPEIESKIRESIKEEEYDSIGLFLPTWIGIYKELNLNLQDIYEQVREKILRDIENYEKWRLKGPEHPRGEIVEEVRRRSSSEFAEFIDRGERRNAKWYSIVRLIRHLFVWDYSPLDNFPEDLKMKTIEEMVGLLAKFGDIFVWDILREELSRVEKGKKYEPIVQQYLPHIAEKFVKHLEESNYSILDEMPEFLSVIDRLPESVVDKGLRAYLKMEYSGRRLLDLAGDSRIPRDIRIDAAKKAMDLYIERKDFEEVVDILLGKYKINLPEESKEYAKEKIREHSVATLACLGWLGEYNKIKTLIDSNLVNPGKTISIGGLAEVCMKRLLERYRADEIPDSTFKENLEVIRSDERVPSHIRKRAENLLNFYFRENKR
jgi:uncharacterized protein (UPF0147 family)